MASRLLLRQISLLRYLSSAAAMFGDQSKAPVDRALRGIDPAALRLQARFACNKRLERIAAVFPRTLEILANDRTLILREFVEAIPPTSKSTLANAREFHAFLMLRWEYEAPRPLYLPDVASCELAMTEVRNVVKDHERVTKDVSKRAGNCIKRRRSVVVLSCAFDVRPIFDSGSSNIVAPKRKTSIAVTLTAGSREVRLVKVPTNAGDALMLLDDWTHARVLDAFGERDYLLRLLAAQELIEMQT